MRHILGFLAFVLISQGAGGILHHFLGWFDLWTVVYRIGFLDGYEVYAGVVLLVLGLAVGGLAEKAGS